MKNVLVIVGPTASGKSDLAVKLAKKFNGEIISADSRQVYKGLNIGTGKITKKEMLGIPHHLLDVAEPKKSFDASQYKILAERAIENIESKNKLPIIVGGTGFYIDTLIGSISLPEVPPNKTLRAKLEMKSAEALFKILQKKDSARAKNIDPRNKVRIIRALEIIEALGKVPVLKQKFDNKFVFIGINPTQEVLEKNIKIRLDSRIKKGMINEVKKLHANGLSWKRLHDLGLEYRYIGLFLQEKPYQGDSLVKTGDNKKQLKEVLFKEIRAYSKRQMTWFKRNKNIRWFEPKEQKLIETYIKNKFDGM
jgi:tRNA dimethylallyltransferase